jgi:hypothetical protein
MVYLGKFVKGKAVTILFYSHPFPFIAIDDGSETHIHKNPSLRQGHRGFGPRVEADEAEA